MLQKQALLGKLVLQIVDKYMPKNAHAFEQKDIYVTQFILQNEEFFKRDKLINQWASLLETQVTYDKRDEDNLQTDEEQASQEPDWDDANMLEEVIPTVDTMNPSQ